MRYFNVDISKDDGVDFSVNGDFIKYFFGEYVKRLSNGYVYANVERERLQQRRLDLLIDFWNKIVEILVR